MLDEDGYLITNGKGVENLAIKHYTNDLRKQTISDKYFKAKDDKEDLCEERIELAIENKSPPWNMDEFETVLKFLKTKQSKDTVHYSEHLTFQYSIFVWGVKLLSEM